ncbi:MAG: Smr/MutS family protein [Bdellovibrio sp.]|nr:Smr/MutS family protein [Bdellovibrio sp.]
MDTEFLSYLEWPKFIDLAAQEAFTLPAKSKLEQFKNPANFAQNIETAKTFSQELDIIHLLEKTSLWTSLKELAHPDSVFEKIKQAKTLDQNELLLIKSWLIAIEAWSQLPQDEIKGLYFKKTFSMLSDPLEPLRIIEDKSLKISEITTKLKPYLEEIIQSISILINLDVIQAKARLGKKYNSKPIQITNEKIFDLKQAAHPLLWWNTSNFKIIKNDIYFAPPTQALLISGPHLGGKTTLLKTLGFACVCAKTGFPIPASCAPTIPFFKQIYFINKISFEDQILQLKSICTTCNNDSLVFLDDQILSTNPEEGTALATAVLETCINKNATVIATTHNTFLIKHFVSDSKVLNASFGFDDSLKQVDFKLDITAPGSSYALETAEKLGLPSEIVVLAIKYLLPDLTKLTSLLLKIKKDSTVLSLAQKEAETLKTEAEKLKTDWLEKAKISFQEALDRARQKLKRIQDQAQDAVREAVKKLDQIHSRKDLDNMRSSLNQTLSNTINNAEAIVSKEAPQTEALSPEKLFDYHIGEKVKLHKWNNLGTILEIVGDKAKVAVGNLQLTLFLNELEPCEEKEKNQPPAVKITNPDQIATPMQELNIRGLRLDDALRELDRYLDQTFRSQVLTEVRVLHGLGTGALREGIRLHLKTLPYVKAFRDALPHQGGAGVTIVELDV